MALPNKVLPGFSASMYAQPSANPTVLTTPTSMTITAAWNPSDAVINTLLRTDAYNGTVDRTFVIAATDGTNIVYYSFVGRVSQFQIDSAPGAEAKCNFTIHPRGNLYGWCNNA